MENNELNLTPKSEAVNTEPKSGKWVPVDIQSVGFPLDAEKGKPFMGPDGAMYVLKEGKSNYDSIRSNANNAIPTPSSIVQMPPIVQPIALVPYASQNQPLLQFDPYSRPPEVEHQIDKPQPRYVKKAYRAVSLAMILFSLVSIFTVLYFNVITAKTFDSNGIDMIKAVLGICGLSSGGIYYTNRISAFMEDFAKSIKEDAFSTLMTVALPILVCLTILIALIIMVKYLVKFSKMETPRCFSLGAFMNLCLSISIFAIIFGMSRGADKDSNLAKFISMDTTFNYGIAVVVNIFLSLIMLIIPFFAKKNAYVLEASPEAKKVYIIND